MAIPDVDPQKIEQALRDFDKQKRKDWGDWTANQQYRYAILWQEQRYPVKEIIRMATGFDEFWGGNEANRYLQRKGFTVIALRGDDNQGTLSQPWDTQKADWILQQLLQAIKEDRGYTDLQEAADYLQAHWDEVTERKAFFPNIKDILCSQPVNLVALEEEIGKKGGTLLGGSIMLRAQVKNFFKSEIRDKAQELIHNLINTCTEAPDAADTDFFIKEAVTLAFHSNKGQPAKSEAALFASVLLTSVFPDKFVDFRQNRWLNLANLFDLEPAPVGASYGELFYWGGRVAIQLAGTPTFRKYFTAEIPNWTVAGLAWQFQNDEEMKALLEQIRTKFPGPDLVPRDALLRYFAIKDYHFSPLLLATFVTSLQTKGFVILSGLSGTGKTKLAQILAEFLPKPAETSVQIEEAVETGEVRIQVQPYMLKYTRFIIPTSAYRLIDLPVEGSSKEIEISFDGKKQNCRLGHFGALELLLKGEVRKWFTQNFKVGDLIVVSPQMSDDNEFLGFTLSKPKPVSQKKLVDNYIFVSVRPDWRDNKNLLGYYNPLTRTYDDTPFLRFLLRTKAHYDQAKTAALPHFVILDEMNLARVEYYFSDFLSVIESGRAEDGYSKEPIHLHSQDPEQTFGASGLTIPQAIKLPPNLYIIGTVNIDETTHAFSPKVLDRAFAIEFNEVDFNNYLTSAVTSLEQAQQDMLQQKLLTGFRRDGKFARIDKTAIAAFTQQYPDYRNQLQSLNDALFEHDLHFGYRVFDEITQFMIIAKQGDLFNDPEKAFDVAVLMKVLPKFNGPRGRLRRPLEKVVAWAATPAAPDTEGWEKQLRTPDECRQHLKQLPGDFTYPETARKALRMLIRLHETGFASFA